MNRTARLAVALAALLMSATLTAVPVFAQADSYVVLARHAEKLDGDDPDLTDAGRARADYLAYTLSPWPVEAVFASQFLRTQATAAPVAAHFGLEVQVVDARDVPGLAARIRTERRPAVAVIGHSNTVPALIRALGVAEVDEIPEHQYDDLFVVRLSEDGEAHLLHFKYGEATPGS